MVDELFPLSALAQLEPNQDLGSSAWDNTINNYLTTSFPHLVPLYLRFKDQLLPVIENLTAAIPRADEYFSQPEYYQNVLINLAFAMEEAISPELHSTNGRLSYHSLKDRIVTQPQPKFITLDGREIEITANFVPYIQNLSETAWLIIKELLTGLPEDMVNPTVSETDLGLVPIFNPNLGLLELAKHDQSPHWLHPSNSSIFAGIYPTRRKLIHAKGVGVSKEQVHSQAAELQRVRSYGSRGIDTDRSITAQQAQAFMSQILHNVTYNWPRERYLRKLYPFSYVQRIIDSPENAEYWGEAKNSTLAKEVMELCRNLRTHNMSMFDYSAKILADIILSGKFRGEIYPLQPDSESLLGHIHLEANSLRSAILRMTDGQKDLLSFGQAFSQDDSIDLSYELSEIRHNASDEFTTTAGMEIPPISSEVGYEAAMKVVTDWITSEHPHTVENFIVSMVTLSRLLRYNPIREIPGHKLTEVVIPLEHGFYRCDILVIPSELAGIDQTNPTEMFRQLAGQTIGIVELKNTAHFNPKIDSDHLDQVQRYVSAILDIEPTIRFDPLYIMQGSGKNIRLIDISSLITQQPTPKRARESRFAEV